LCLERPDARVYDLIPGPPSGQVRLADRLEEAKGQLAVEQVVHWEADTDLEALQNSTVRVQDLVLEWADEPSSLAAMLSSTAELLDGHINAAATNGVR
jgi:hypothetical protein